LTLIVIFAVFKVKNNSFRLHKIGIARRGNQ
jgi:hypothetical protein